MLRVLLCCFILLQYNLYFLTLCWVLLYCIIMLQYVLLSVSCCYMICCFVLICIFLNISFYYFMLLCDQFYYFMLFYIVLWYIVFYFIDINCLMEFSIFAYSHQFSVLETLLHCQIIHISYLVLRCNNLCRNILAIVQFWFFKIHTNLAY